MPVRFALVGCGKVTERVALPQLSRCAQAEVGALVDVDRACAERLADQFGIDRRRIWTDWRRMLREADIDAVGVNVPNVLHQEVTVAALEAKKHVMVEKPMAMTLAEADAMIAAAKASGRCLMVEHAQRFDPANEAAHALLRSGRLGTLRHLRGRIGHAGPEHWSGRDPTWFTDPAQSGGGALMDVGIHMVDLVRWLSGKEVARICATAATLEKRIAVEDNAACVLEFADGTLGSVEASWTTRPYQVTMDFYGERGRLHTEFGAAHPVTAQLGGAGGDPNKPMEEEVRPEAGAASRPDGAYAHLTTCILRGITPEPSGAEGRATLAVVLAAYESIRTGGWANVSETPA